MPATIIFLPEADPVCQIFDREGDFNYDIKFKEATRESPLLTEKAEKLKKDGYAINHARVRLGSGRDVFMEGKKLLQSWGYSALTSSPCVRINFILFSIDLQHF